MKKYSVMLIVMILLSVIPLSSTNTNAQSVLQEGLSYPYDNPNEWEIINGYNDGRFHGSVMETNGVGYDYFYAYYGLDIARKDRRTGGESIYLPADAYYFRTQRSPNNCVDFALGIEAGGSTVYLEMCHIDLTSRFVKGDLVQEFLPRGTFIGTVLPDGGCPNCETAHLHMAVHLSPANMPWSGAGFDSCAVASQDAGWCRLPIAFQTYAHFDLSIGGVNRPPLENSLFQVENQYCTRPDCVGGGSDEGNPTPVPTGAPSPTPQTGNSHVDLYENTNYQPAQYGWDNPTGGWVNVPDYMNDRVSSINLDAGYSVMVAKDGNGSGTRKCFVVSHPDLSGAYYDDGTPVTDTITSVWVYSDSTCGGQYLGVEPGDTVTVWNDPTYWNTHYGWHDPFGGNVQNYNANAITSIGVTPGWSAVLYRSPNLGDGFACFTSSDPDLSNNQFNDGYPVNDNVESIEIFHDGNCSGRMHAPTVTTLSATVTNQATGEVTIAYNIIGAAPGYSVHTDFGDSTSFDLLGPAIQTSVTHNYPVGNHTINVGIKGTDGITYPYSLPVVIAPPATPTPIPPPTLSITLGTVDQNTGLVPFVLDWANANPGWHQVCFGDNQCFDVEGASGHREESHIYNPGTFTMSFTVNGLDGLPYTVNQQIVMPEPSYSLTINSVDGVSGLVNFTAICNYCSNGWHRVDFGNGQYVDYFGSTINQVGSHVYNPGTYTMTFTVNGRDGRVYTTTQPVVIAYPPPTISLSFTQGTGETFNYVEVIATWSGAAEDVQTVDWGDGSSVSYYGGSGTSVDHPNGDSHWYAVGNYTMTFTVKGLDGNYYTATQPVNIVAP